MDWTLELRNHQIHQNRSKAKTTMDWPCLIWDPQVMISARLDPKHTNPRLPPLASQHHRFSPPPPRRQWRWRCRRRGRCSAASRNWPAAASAPTTACSHPPPRQPPPPRGHRSRRRSPRPCACWRVASGYVYPPYYLLVRRSAVNFQICWLFKFLCFS